MANANPQLNVIVDSDDDEPQPSPSNQSRRGGGGGPRKISVPRASTTSGGRKPSQPPQNRTEQRGYSIGEHHVVLPISEPDATYKETRGTFLLHEVFREHQRESLELNPRSIYQSVLAAIRDEFPFVARDDAIVLVECTRDVIRQRLVYEACTHSFAGQDARYGVAVSAERALEFYHEIWVNRIPCNAKDREAWVADIEDRFCAWQLTEVAQYQSNEKIENLRLAIQFVKKWMASPEIGVTEQMVPGHLKLIQKGWSELKDSEMPSEEERRAAAAAAATAESTDHVDLPHPRQYFQTLPTEKAGRKEYVRRINENYVLWKRTVVAQQFRKNILLAFEKLIQHTNEWLEYTNTDKAITESTLKMFFGLLRDRWNEFLDKTEKYSPILTKRSRGDEDDADDDHGSGPQKKARASRRQAVEEDDESVTVEIETCVAVMSDMTNDAKPAADPEFPPVEEVEWDDDDDAAYSVVSLPLPKQLDKNPLKSDATKGLFGAVEENSLSQVQHFFSQGATGNGRDEFGETPLHRAAAVGTLPILDHLRLWGANPWLRNSADELPVHISCWYGHPGATKFLLKQLGRVSLSSLKDGYGRTPLHHACQQGHIEVVRLLVQIFEREQVINLRDKDDLSPRHYAVMGGHIEMIQFLDGLGADQSDDGSFDPNNLYHACLTGRLGLVQRIVEATDADLEAKDNQGRTPLACARQKGHSHVVEWIESCLAH